MSKGVKAPRSGIGAAASVAASDAITAKPEVKEEAAEAAASAPELAALTHYEFKYF